ncbi:unnamed protein product [Cuscuta epithymum]|uniref:Uncharacterized protein n=1 Tax=Cuscuta epithymum TaxID=186058 RepID=A0AAV0CLX6_9ASTE|nr:unnamed protein product [Cuscuta epithymum]
MEMAGIEIEGGRLQGIDNHRSEAITMGKFQEQISGEQKDKDEAIDDDEEEAVESEENRFGATTIVAMVRPPPEPPPRVDRRVLEFAYLFGKVPEIGLQQFENSKIGLTCFLFPK